jgi:hypothetical protein
MQHTFQDTLLHRRENLSTIAVISDDAFPRHSFAAQDRGVYNLCRSTGIDGVALQSGIASATSSLFIGFCVDINLLSLGFDGD